VTVGIYGILNAKLALLKPAGYRLDVPRAFIFAMTSAALALAACTVNQTLDIEGDGSGTLATHAEVAPILHDYLVSLAEAAGGSLKDGRVFDAESIRQGFKSRPGIVVEKSSAPTPSSMDLVLGFDSLSYALEHQDELSGPGAVTLEDEGGATTLRLRFNRAAWNQVSAVFPPLRDPIVQQLGPQGTGTVSEKDYLSMISFSIGDAAPGLLRKSFITVTVRPHGQIISQSGGTLTGGSVVFRIPVLRMLVLDTPLEYSVTYRLNR
jgi:hypothetical protein